ncbi:hypothetical protein EYC84_008529 [Monilinia fructicola]|uniref:Uncharacterized protein n=1 Tax=Monilinia fructicola TaxID=38448 RepID=A0A5M9JEW5_MONFR|nr:hypothetical protein EYC84_008529 [Monilinia fructicola]
MLERLPLHQTLTHKDRLKVGWVGDPRVVSGGTRIWVYRLRYGVKLGYWNMNMNMNIEIRREGKGAWHGRRMEPLQNLSEGRFWTEGNESFYHLVIILCFSAHIAGDVQSVITGWDGVCSLQFCFCLMAFTAKQQSGDLDVGYWSWSFFFFFFFFPQGSGMGVALLFVPVYGLFCFEWVNLYQEGVKIKQQMELVG